VIKQEIKIPIPTLPLYGSEVICDFTVDSKFLKKIQGLPMCLSDKEIWLYLKTIVLNNGIENKIYIKTYINHTYENRSADTYEFSLCMLCILKE